MNSLQISTDPTMLSADLSSLTTSPSVSTFMPEEDASICPLLPSTPSPPLDFTHPLTPSTGNDDNNIEERNDLVADTSSSGSSTDIGLNPDNEASNSLFNNTYPYYPAKCDNIIQENGMTGNMNMQLTKDMPSFVHWNWPLIRKCTFLLFLSGIAAMLSMVVYMIINLPSSCNPPVAWYKGNVFYEIFPASFQDSNNDGLGDLRGLIGRADYLKNLNVGAVRLNSIFPSQHYPDHYQNVTSLTEIDDILGKLDDLKRLSATLHERNISLLLDLPIYPFVKHLSPSSLRSQHYNESGGNYDGDNANDEVPIISEFLRLSRSIPEENFNTNPITNAIRFWISRASIDGFYIKGLEHFYDDPYLVENIKDWKYLLGSDRILIVSKKLIDQVNDEIAEILLQYVDLVDVYLDVTNGTQYIAEQVKEIMGNHLYKVDQPWIHWSLGGISERRISSKLSPNATLATTLMELMLPGTPNIFYGDEISLEEINDVTGEHSETKHLHHLSTMLWNAHQNEFTGRESLPWLPKGSASFHHLDQISDMIQLRIKSPSIYKNAVIKEDTTMGNTNIRASKNDLLIIERWYPRRHSFVSISNFGPYLISLDLSALFYSGELIIGGLSPKNSKIYFTDFEIRPFETLIIKLHK
uniref:Putative alpha amylase catalytic domain found in solute carrier family 3 member 1 protein n=1 Tax=Corethrella appendiculata TaxID=1370023 RepID=U5EPQ3_9DIPT